jgi:hypothetical protein
MQRKNILAEISSYSSDADTEDLIYTIVRPEAYKGFNSTFPATVPAPNSRSISMSASQIDGYSWNADKPIDTIVWNELYEWTISGSGSHPFHLHLYRKYSHICTDARIL